MIRTYDTCINSNLPICVLYLKNQVADGDEIDTISYVDKNRYDELMRTLTHVSKVLQKDIVFEILSVVEKTSKTMNFNDWEYVVELLIHEMK